MQLTKSIVIALAAAVATTFAAPAPVSAPAPEASTNAILPPGGRFSKTIIAGDVNDAENSKIIIFPGGGGRPRPYYPGGYPTVIIIKPYGPYGPMFARGGPGRPQKRSSAEEEVNADANAEESSKIIINPGGGYDPTVIVIKPYGPFGPTITHGGPIRHQKRTLTAEEEENVNADIDEALKALLLPATFNPRLQPHGNSGNLSNPDGVPSSRPFPKRSSSSSIEIDTKSSRDKAEAQVDLQGANGMDVEARSKYSAMIYPPKRPYYPDEFHILS
ncbi:hypothetical protein BGW39_002110 [Mortierella sp. 14UC]|nr:hypothetical protein BGW39_002110 [Mortierella sp. 14UC]